VLTHAIVFVPFPVNAFKRYTTNAEAFDWLASPTAADSVATTGTNEPTPDEPVEEVPVAVAEEEVEVAAAAGAAVGAVEDESSTSARLPVVDAEIKLEAPVKEEVRSNHVNERRPVDVIDVRIMDVDSSVRSLVATAWTLCLDTLGNEKEGGDLGYFACHNQGGNQGFWFTPTNEIRVAVGTAQTPMCLDSWGPMPARVVRSSCHGHGGNQVC